MPPMQYFPSPKSHLLILSPPSEAEIEPTVRTPDIDQPTLRVQWMIDPLAASTYASDKTRFKGIQCGFAIRSLPGNTQSQVSGTIPVYRGDYGLWPLPTADKGPNKGRSIKRKRLYWIFDATRPTLKVEKVRVVPLDQQYALLNARESNDLGLWSALRGTIDKMEQIRLRNAGAALEGGFFKASRMVAVAAPPAALEAEETRENEDSAKAMSSKGVEEEDAGPLQSGAALGNDSQPVQGPDEPGGHVEGKDEPFDEGWEWNLVVEGSWDIPDHLEIEFP